MLFKYDVILWDQLIKDEILKIHYLNYSNRVCLK